VIQSQETAGKGLRNGTFLPIGQGLTTPYPPSSQMSLTKSQGLCNKILAGGVVSLGNSVGGWVGWVGLDDYDR
jgi:hypothetical protein